MDYNELYAATVDVILIALFTAMVGVALFEATFAVTRKWRKIKEEGK